MLGEALVVSPVLTSNTTSLTVYLPQGTWYNIWDYSAVNNSNGGGNVTLTVPLGDIPVNIRDGSIVPMQRYANTTKAVMQAPITLVVALRNSMANATSNILAPYASEPTCAAAGYNASNFNASNNASNSSGLVSCGFLYLDNGDNITAGGPDSLQVRHTHCTLSVLD